MKAMAGLDEGQHDTLPEDPVAEHQGHFYDEVYWQKFRESRQYTNKYMQRIAGIFEASHGDERRPPELGDSLWEIGCKVRTASCLLNLILSIKLRLELRRT